MDENTMTWTWQRRMPSQGHGRGFNPPWCITDINKHTSAPAVETGISRFRSRPNGFWPSPPSLLLEQCNAACSYVFSQNSQNHYRRGLFFQTVIVRTSPDFAPEIENLSLRTESLLSWPVLGYSQKTDLWTPLWIEPSQSSSWPLILPLLPLCNGGTRIIIYQKILPRGTINISFHDRNN